MTPSAPAFQHCRTISVTIFGLVSRLFRSAIPADVRFHQYDVGSRDKAVDASQFLNRNSRQQLGIVSLNDRHLGQGRINRHGVTAFQIDGQLGLRSLTAFARTVSKACGSGRRSSLINASRRLSMAPSLEGMLH